MLSAPLYQLSARGERLGGPPCFFPGPRHKLRRVGGACHRRKRYDRQNHAVKRKGGDVADADEKPMAARGGDAASLRPAELLHYVGEAPEGPWAIFTEPGGVGYRLVSVVIPRTLWMYLTRRDPFSSEMQIIESVGRAAIDAARARGPLPAALWVSPEDIGERMAEYQSPWEAMSRCGRCHQVVPSGEVAEGIKNALPPNTRGDTEVLVLCPVCLVQTPFVLTPFGAQPVASEGKGDHPGAAPV